MEMKHYHAENAGRLIGGVRFNGYTIIAGSQFGVYATEDLGIIAKLDSLSLSPASGVTAISASEYEACLKKNLSPSEPYPISKPASPQPGPIKGTVAALVVNEPDAPPPEDKSEVAMDGQPLETPEDAIRVEEAKGRTP